MGDDCTKPIESKKPPFLTSLILDEKFDVVFKILQIVYSYCPWVWSAENLDGVDRLLPEESLSPSLLETCLDLLWKSGKVHEEHYVLSELRFSTKSACLFCVNEPVHLEASETLAFSPERPSIEETGNVEESVLFSEMEMAQASASTAFISSQAIPTYLDWLKMKRDELNCLGEESASILAYTNFSLRIKKEMANGWPMTAVCSLTGTLHLKLLLTLLRCGVHPNYPVHEESVKRSELRVSGKQVREDFVLMGLLLRYECFKWIANNVDFSLSPAQLKNSGIFRQFYLAQTKFQSAIWVDEHLKEKLVRNVYDLNGNAMQCSKEDYIHITSDIFQVLSYIIKLSSVNILTIEGDNSILDIVLGCGDIELCSIIADSGKLSFDCDSQVKRFLFQYKAVSTEVRREMERLMMKAKFNRSSYCRYIPCALTAGHVKLTKMMIKFSNCETFSGYSGQENPFINSVSGTLPVFILPLFRVSFWRRHVQNWAIHFEYNTMIHPRDLERAVDSIEYVLDVAVRPLLEDCIKDVSPVLPIILNIAKVSQYGVLIEDIERMNEDFVYFVFGNRGSLQSLCVRKIFRNLVKRKILGFRGRSKPASDTVGPVVFPISVNSMIASCKENTLSGCNQCTKLKFLCITCRESEWSVTHNMLNSACDAAEIPRKFAASLGMECLRYEVISRISCCADRNFEQTAESGVVNRLSNLVEYSVDLSRYPNLSTSTDIDDVSNSSSSDDPSSSFNDSSFGSVSSRLEADGGLAEDTADRSIMEDTEEISDVTSSFSDCSSSCSSSSTSNSDWFYFDEVENTYVKQRTMCSSAFSGLAATEMPQQAENVEVLASVSRSETRPSVLSTETSHQGDNNIDAPRVVYQYEQLLSSEED